VVIEALARQTQEPSTAARPLDDVAKIVPGIGNVTAVALGSGNGSVGKTLKQIDLRAQTGATVIAIERPGSAVVYPTADEALLENDVVVLTGSQEAVSAARELLR
jgi:CPA2 family monovalent cation:H+ antiporter-2